MTNTALQVFNYEGSNITFKTENGTWVNATEMAKNFCKKPAEWLRLPSTTAFFEALVKVRFGEGKVGKSHFENGPYYGYVVTERGGLNPCTWFHEDAAIEFARWLSPVFAIWCNDRIKEITTGGYGIRTHQTSFSAAEHAVLAIEGLFNENEMLRRTVKGLQTRLQKRSVEVKELRALVSKRTEYKQLQLEAPNYFSQFLSQTDLLDEPMKRVPLETIWNTFQTYCLTVGITYQFNRRSFASFMSEQPLGKIKTNKGISFFKY